MLVFRSWSLIFVYTFASACVFGSGNRNANKDGRGQWFEGRERHEGSGLSNADLRSIASLGNEQHFFSVLEKILIPRVVDTPNHVLVRKFIVDTLESLNWTVEESHFQADTPVGQKTFTNVVATLDPSATRRLVIACHYDSKLTPTGFLGATDSAVPCSMMINLASRLQGPLDFHRKQGSEVTLQLMFIDGEEAFDTWSSTDSLYGSRHLANKLYSSSFPSGGFHDTREIDRIDLFVLLDLLGTEDCSFFSFFRNSEKWYTRLASFEKRLMDLELINRRRKLFQEKSYYNSGIEDDHIPFLKKGVAVMHVISAPFPTVWHTMADNMKALHAPTIYNLNTILRAFVVDYLHLNL